jgi:hypothetical protein
LKSFALKRQLVENSPPTPIMPVAVGTAHDRGRMKYLMILVVALLFSSTALAQPSNPETAEQSEIYSVTDAERFEHERLAELLKQAREQADLKAQQDMAAWALGMLVITTIATLISLAGLLFLASNLRQVREANDLVRRQIEAETAPRIIARLVAMTHPHEALDFPPENPPAGVAPGSRNIRARMTFENVGKGFANIKEHAAHFMLVPSGPLPAPPVFFSDLTRLTIAPGEKFSAGMGPDEWWLDDETLLQILGGVTRVLAIGTVIYEARGHRPWKYKAAYIYDQKTSTFDEVDDIRYWQEAQAPVVVERKWWEFWRRMKRS